MIASATVPPGTPGRVRGISLWSDVWILNLLKGPQARYSPGPHSLFRACFWVSFLNDFLEPNDPPKGAKLGPMLGHFWSHVAQISEHVCEHVSSSIFDGFWEASEPPFFDFRRGENTIFTFLLRSLLASFSTPKTLPKSIKKRSQEGFKRLLKGSKNRFKKR